MRKKGKVLEESINTQIKVIRTLGEGGINIMKEYKNSIEKLNSMISSRKFDDNLLPDLLKTVGQESLDTVHKVIEEFSKLDHKIKEVSKIANDENDIKSELESAKPVQEYKEEIQDIRSAFNAVNENKEMNDNDNDTELKI